MHTQAYIRANAAKFVDDGWVDMSELRDILNEQKAVKPMLLARSPAKHGPMRPVDDIEFLDNVAGRVIIRFRKHVCTVPEDFICSTDTHRALRFDSCHQTTGQVGSSAVGLESEQTAQWTAFDLNLQEFLNTFDMNMPDGFVNVPPMPYVLTDGSPDVSGLDYGLNTWGP
jgi:hypothetical protein